MNTNAITGLTITGVAIGHSPTGHYYVVNVANTINPAGLGSMGYGFPLDAHNFGIILLDGSFHARDLTTDRSNLRFSVFGTNL